MDRQNVKKLFEKIGSRLTIRNGFRPDIGLVSLNVTRDKEGEHFTMTVNPILKDEEITIQSLDVDKNLKQMLLLISGPDLTQDLKGVIRYRYADPARNKVIERLLVGHDESHWFVAGVTASTTIKQAFARLRPEAVTRVMHERGVKDKDWRRRKTKGFIRQGEWFFVPVEYAESKFDIIHKDEPINRRGGKPHMVGELIRSGGSVVYSRGDKVITNKEYRALPASEQVLWMERRAGARVLARGKVKHPDHHTITLKGWHEVHLSTEVGSSASAFID